MIFFGDPFQGPIGGLGDIWQESAGGGCGIDWQSPCPSGCVPGYVVTKPGLCPTNSNAAQLVGKCLRSGSRAAHCDDGSYYDLLADGTSMRSATYACDPSKAFLKPLSFPAAPLYTAKVGTCVPIGSRIPSSDSQQCFVGADGSCPPVPAQLDPTVPLPLFDPAVTPPVCQWTAVIRNKDGTTIDCKNDRWVVSCESQTQKTPDWVIACTRVESCPSGSFQLPRLPFPAGSKYVVTSQGYSAIAIPATDAIKANYQKWLAVHKAAYDQGKDTRGVYPKIADGTSPYGWRLISTYHMEWNAYGNFPLSGAPSLINAHDAKSDYCSEFVYNEWGYYYGASTSGYLLLINIPYANPDNTNVIPWITDPLKLLIGVVVEVVKAIVGEIIDILKDITDEIKNLLCSLGPAGAIATAVGGAYFAGKGGMTAATSVYNSICSQGACPSGYVKDVVSGTCVASNDSTWLYVAGATGVVVLGMLGLLAFKKKKRAG